MLPASSEANRLRRRREGFTLIELLVVMAVIGILVSMLLPALSFVRDVARRTQCSNHLKQIGTAITLHVNEEGHYPQGRNSREPIGVSWAFRLLPFLEYRDAYDSYDETQPAFADANAHAMRTPVAVFFCPGRRGPTADRNFDNNGDPPTVTGAAAGGDYAANPGSHYMNATGTPPDRLGPIYTFSKVAPSEVKDGAAQTIAIGDKHKPPPLDDLIDEMVHHFQGDNAFFAADSPWTIFADTSRGIAAGSNDTSRTKFGSEHPGVAQFLFLDGHVEKVENHTQTNILRALSTIADGVDPDSIPVEDEDPDDT